MANDVPPIPTLHTKQAIASMSFLRELLDSYIAMKLPISKRKISTEIALFFKVLQHRQLLPRYLSISCSYSVLFCFTSPTRSCGDSQVFLANAKHSKSSTYAVKVQTSRRTATKKIEHEAKIWKLCASHRKLGLFWTPHEGTALWRHHLFLNFPSHSNVLEQ